MCDCTSGNDGHKDVDARHKAGHDETHVNAHPLGSVSHLDCGSWRSAAAAADHGAHRFIGAEIFGAFDVEQCAEF
jgi:hypothetical protein